MNEPQLLKKHYVHADHDKKDNIDAKNDAKNRIMIKMIVITILTIVQVAVVVILMLLMIMIITVTPMIINMIIVKVPEMITRQLLITMIRIMMS